LPTHTYRKLFSHFFSGLKQKNLMPRNTQKHNPPKENKRRPVKEKKHPMRHAVEKKQERPRKCNLPEEKDHRDPPRAIKGKFG
jgi:hypothetical protein